MSRPTVLLALVLAALLAPGAASAQKAGIEARVTILPPPQVPAVRIEPAVAGPGASPMLVVSGERTWGVLVEIGSEPTALVARVGASRRELSLAELLPEPVAGADVPVRVILAPY